MRTCYLCKTKQELECFSFANLKKNTRQYRCKSCVNKYAKEYYKKHKKKLRTGKLGRVNKRKRFIYSYLKTHGCAKCGIKDPVVLEFDHHKGKKTTDVSYLIRNSSMEKLKKEISICQILCSNCHKRKTAKEQKWNIRGN